MALFSRAPTTLSRPIIRAAATRRPVLLRPLILATTNNSTFRYQLAPTTSARGISTESFSEGPIFKAQLHEIMATQSPHTTISEAIITDHKELHTYYQEICKAHDMQDHDGATRWQNQFVWELARHSVGEELVVYPAFEKLMGEKGKAMAEKDRQEHHELKIKLKEFQNTKSTSSEFRPLIDNIYTTLSSHIREEEQQDLPALETALKSHITDTSASSAGTHETGGGHGTMDTASLAKAFERTKKFVPTRSHPSAGENPLFESAAGLLAAPMDKLRDLFTKFPKE